MKLVHSLLQDIQLIDEEVGRIPLVCLADAIQERFSVSLSCHHRLEGNPNLDFGKAG
jgi:hypothetical protein